MKDYLIENRKRGSSTKTRHNLAYYSDKFNIVLIGDTGVGKTSILKSFRTSENFEKIHNLIPETLSDLKDNTEQVNLEFTYQEKLFLFKIWNYKYISNDEIVNNFLNKVDAFILVYSVTDRKSFINIDKWMEEINKKINTKNVVFYVIGNKCDLEEERQVGFDEIDQLSEKNKFKFYEISAFIPEEVEDSFNKILTNIIKSGYFNSNLGTFTTEEEVKDSKEKDCCCSRIIKNCNIY